MFFMHGNFGLSSIILAVINPIAPFKIKIGGDSMNKKAKKLWHLVMLLAFDLVMLILISSLVCTRSRAMHLGSDGERVAQVQRHLAQNGFYEGEADGIFSLETRSAVKKFQKNCGIEASGETDYETLEALGISARTAVCFTAEAELLARCIQLNGCLSYHEMLKKGVEILESTGSIGTLGSYAASTFPDIFSQTDEPMCQAYSAAVQAMRIFSQQTHGLL